MPDFKSLSASGCFTFLFSGIFLAALKPRPDFFSVVFPINLKLVYQMSLISAFNQTGRFRFTRHLASTAALSAFFGLCRCRRALSPP
jgi:hypothetical protein